MVKAQPADVAEFIVERMPAGEVIVPLEFPFQFTQELMVI